MLKRQRKITIIGIWISNQKTYGDQKLAATILYKVIGNDYNTESISSKNILQEWSRNKDSIWCIKIILICRLSWGLPKEVFQTEEKVRPLGMKKTTEIVNVWVNGTFWGFLLEKSAYAGCRFNSMKKIPPWEGNCNPPSVFLPGKSYDWRKLVRVTVVHGGQRVRHDWVKR